MKNKIIIAISTVVSVVSQLCLPAAVWYAFEERGYFAFGGEWGFLAISFGAVFFGIQSAVNMYAERVAKEKARTIRFENALRKIAKRDVAWVRIKDAEKIKMKMQIGDKVKANVNITTNRSKYVKIIREYEIVEKSRYICFGKRPGELFRKYFQYADIVQILHK